MQVMGLKAYAGLFQVNYLQPGGSTPLETAIQRHWDNPVIHLNTYFDLSFDAYLMQFFP